MDWGREEGFWEGGGGEVKVKVKVLSLATMRRMGAKRILILIGMARGTSPTLSAPRGLGPATH